MEQAFWDWIIETYGMAAYTAMKTQTQNIDITPYYTYWQKYVRPKVLPETIPTTSGTKSGLNYTPIYTIDVPIGGGTIEIDGVEYPAGDTEYKTLTIYAPVFPSNEVNETDLIDIYSNIYGVFDDGTKYNDGQPISVEELSAWGIIRLDPATGNVDASQILDATIGASLLQDVMNRVDYNLTDDMKQYIIDQSERVKQGATADIDYIVGEIGKMHEYPEYATSLRLTGRLSGDIPESYQQNDQARAEALSLVTAAPQIGQGSDELKEYRDYLERNKETYEKYKAKIESGVINPQYIPSMEDQAGYALVQTYDEIQKREQAIASGEQRPFGMDEYAWEVAKHVSETQGIDIGALNNIESLATQYVMNPESTAFPEWDDETKKKMTNLGIQSLSLAEQNAAAQEAQRQREEQARKERESKWLGLVQRSKQRVTRL